MTDICIGYHDGNTSVSEHVYKGTLNARQLCPECEKLNKDYTQYTRTIIEYARRLKRVNEQFVV